MTFVGRVLVVLNVVLGVVVMVFSGAVYMVHNTWSDKYASLEDQRAELERQNTELSSQLATAQMEAATAKQEMQDQIARALAEKEREVRAVGLDYQRYQDLQKTNEQNLTNYDFAKRATDFLTKQNRNLQQVIDDLRQKNNVLSNETAKLRDDLFNLTRQFENVVARYNNLLLDSDRLRKLLVANGINPDALAPDETLDPPPRELQARVEAVNRVGGLDGVETVLISVGEDDGVKVGHKLFVVGDRKYLGTIRIDRVEADRAVGVVIERNPNTKINQGDQVVAEITP